MRHHVTLVGTVLVVGIVTVACRSLVPVAATPSPSGTRVAQATPTGRSLPCQTRTYHDDSGPLDAPLLQFCNNTPQPLTIRRLDMGGLKSIVLPPDTYGDLSPDGPALGGLKRHASAQGPGVLFGVFDQGGQSLGRFLFTPEYLLDSGPHYVCLSLASEPPFEVRRAKDFPFPCP